MLDLWALRVLVEVADQGSFSRAAERLSMTQPAVSRQVGNLERHVGLALFQRGPRGVRATAVGEAAIAEARDVLARTHRMQLRLNALADAASGELRMSAFPSANTAFVPAALLRFRKMHPAVELTLTATDSTVAAGAVRDGRIDLAMVTSWDNPDPEGVELSSLFRDELQLALPPDHRLAREDRVNLRDLTEEAWIEGAHPDCLGPLGQLTEALGGRPRIVMTCDDWNAKRTLVAAGAGISFLPRSATAAREGIVLVPTTPCLSRRVYAVAAQKPMQTPAASTMLAVLEYLAPRRAERAST